MSSPLRNAFAAMAFDEAAVRALYADEHTVRREIVGTVIASALMALLLGATAWLLGRQFPMVFSAFSPIGWFWVGAGAGLVVAVLLFAISIGLTHVLARRFGGTASIGQYLTAFVWTSVPLQLLSLAAFVLLLTPLGALAQLAVTAYTLAIQTFVVRVTYSVSWLGAIVAILIPLLVLFVLVVFFFLALAAWGIVVGLGALRQLGGL